MKIRRILLGAFLLLQLADFSGSMNACASMDAFRVFEDPFGIFGAASRIVQKGEETFVEPFKTEISPPDISAASRNRLACRLTPEYLSQYGSVKGPRLLVKAAQIQPEIIYAMKSHYWDDHKTLWTTILFLASYGVPLAIEWVSRHLANFEVKEERFHLKNPQAALEILSPYVKDNQEWALNRYLYILEFCPDYCEKSRKLILRKANQGQRWGFQTAMASIAKKRRDLTDRDTKFISAMVVLDELVRQEVSWAEKEKAWFLVFNGKSKRDFTEFKNFIAPYIEKKKSWAMRIQALGLMFGKYGWEQDTDQGMKFIRESSKESRPWANELLSMAYFYGWGGAKKKGSEESDETYSLFVRAKSLSMGSQNSIRFKKAVRAKMNNEKWAINLAMRLELAVLCDDGDFSYNYPKHVTEFANMKRVLRKNFINDLLRGDEIVTIFSTPQEFMGFVSSQIKLGNDAMARKKFDCIQKQKAGYTGGFPAAMAFMQSYLKDHPRTNKG